jgi:hypothetical protein
MITIVLIVSGLLLFAAFLEMISIFEKSKP